MICRLSCVRVCVFFFFLFLLFFFVWINAASSSCTHALKWPLVSPPLTEFKKKKEKKTEKKSVMLL